VRWTDPEHAVEGVGPTAHRALVGRLGPVGRDGRRHREVVVDGWRFVLEVEPERLARLRETASRTRGSAGQGGPSDVRAAIPGRIVAVSVAIGDTVEVGQQLLVIEAMKMQNEVRSPRAGVVAKVAVAPGDTVDLGAVLVGIA
jgi:biotin carboxyl carrier protein